jgi:transcriptional regulator with XRE-family HTH domain
MTASTDTHHPLAWHRKSKLLSQRDMARKTRISASTIYLLEHGLTEPTLLTMRHCCEVLGVDWRDVTEFRASMAAKGVAP